MLVFSRESGQAERLDHLLGLCDQRLGVLPFACHDDHKIIGVADNPVVGFASTTSRLASVLTARRVPCSSEMLVERGERDVSHQRRENSALWRAGDRSHQPALLGHDPGLQERLDQRQHAPVSDSRSHPVQNGRV